MEVVISVLPVLVGRVGNGAGPSRCARNKLLSWISGAVVFDRGFHGFCGYDGGGCRRRAPITRLLRHRDFGVLPQPRANMLGVKGVWYLALGVEYFALSIEQSVSMSNEFGAGKC